MYVKLLWKQLGLKQLEVMLYRGKRNLLECFVYQNRNAHLAG